MKRGSLVIVGTGIKAVGQITQEAVAHMRRADRLFYLPCDPVTSDWIQELNPRAVSLMKNYAEGRPRRETYKEWVDLVLDAVRENLCVCLAMYGHPGVCVDSTHAALRQATAEGFPAIMLPGVSCDDCLFADLGIDPAREGFQSYEATSFLLCRRAFDPCAAMIIWQVGLIGQVDYRMEFSVAAVPLLVEYLAQTYGLAHEATLYEAAVYPVCEPRIEKVPLSRVPDMPINSTTSMFVPPLRRAQPDSALVSRVRELVGNVSVAIP